MLIKREGKTASNREFNMREKIITAYSIIHMQEQRGSLANDSCFLGSLVYGIRFSMLSAWLSKIDLNVKSLHGKRLMMSQRMLHKTFINSIDSTTFNNSTIQRDVNLISHSLKVNKTSEISISNITEILSTTEIQIPISYIYDGPNGPNYRFEFNGSSPVTKIQTNEILLTVPPFNIPIHPMTKIDVTYNFYQYDYIAYNLLDFVIDVSSNIVIPDYEKDIYYGDVKCCEACFLFKQTETKSLPLIDFLHQNRELFEKLDSVNGTTVGFEENEQTFILKNVPATERVATFGVEIVFKNSSQRMISHYF